MSEKTGIAWCDSTSNAVVGCEKRSPGCFNCYAEFSAPARQLRARGIETWGPNGVRHETKGFEKAMLMFNRFPWICDTCGKATDEPEHGHHWTPVPAAESVVCGGTSFHRRRVFVNSLSDWLDPRWPVATLARTLDVWRRCPDIEIITCTKRPELFDRRLQAVIESQERYAPLESWLIDWAHAGNAPRNITILATVENQEQADNRIPRLLRIPAARRGLSMEPLLSHVVISPEVLRQLQWVIIGSESGSRRRFQDGYAAAALSLIQQCADAGVACFHKQMPINGEVSKNITEWTAPFQVQQFPKY